MSEHDPLQAFFEAGDVPAPDPGFRLSVMEAVAVRRFRLELAARLVAGVVLLVLAVALAPRKRKEKTGKRELKRLSFAFSAAEGGAAAAASSSAASMRS